MSKNNQNNSTENLPFIVTNKAASLCILAVIIFVLSGAAWYRQVYNSPRRVFAGMLRDSLSISSITRSTRTGGQDGQTQKVEQLSLVPDAAVRSWVQITQTGNTDSGSSKVVTETIGTRAVDYSRYLSISTEQKGQDGKVLDYSSVENTWGRSSLEQGQPQYFQQASLGLIPFANLRTDDRQAILDQLEKKKVYQVDYGNVKPKRVGGKSALVFTAKVDIANYIEVFKDMAKRSGLGAFKDLDPEAYRDSEPIQVSITVDKLSRQLLELSYAGDAEQTETFSGHGLSQPIALPDKTVPVSQLQQKIQEIQ